tara:strand:- start:1177 stop:1554 length:378 start_codon:yes stop_codon:yes gene_type:complete
MAVDEGLQAVRNERLAKRFVQYHLANPGTWEQYESAILNAIEAGRETGGVKAITESLRWGSRQHLVNDFDPFYSRLFAHAHPRHASFFEYKESAADYVNYSKLMEGDAKGALNWEDPQLELGMQP